MELGPPDRQLMFADDPITTARPGPELLPLAIESRDPHLSLAAWSARRKPALEALLLTHGGLLFRGFAGGGELAAIESFAAVFIRTFTDYEFALTPRVKLGERVATSTIFAPQFFLPWHGECCAQPRWPRRIVFGCRVPASRGGETILADARQVYRRLAPAIREPFERLGLRYVRTLVGKGELELAFPTAVRADIERFCADRGYRLRFLAEDAVRTEIDLPATLPHPVTGEPVWFNAFHTYYASAHEPSVFHLPADQSAVDRFGVAYGDGSAIERGVFDQVWAAYREESVAFPWRAGDVLLLDNLLVAHGRNPYHGPRSVVVTMGDS